MDETIEDLRERSAALQKALVAASYIKDDCVPSQIKEGLYLGSLAAAKNKAALKSENVTHILTVASFVKPAYPRDFVYKTIDVLDQEDADLARYFDECIYFIEEAKRMGGSVLIHCFAGVSRSATIVLAYLMKKYSMSLSQALECVWEKRPSVCPNSGFLKSLRNFEKSLQGETKNSHKV